ncbi:hypothetical protein QEN35_06535 [Gordonia alkanivorans]|uniref:hypothetical protein n=1 Tax=Gordonia alkanivorans TaxID=84096 RepID=UPI000FDF04BB|nr:hypothetical protein [Gordonia alkanivorans]AZZ81166.1 hypothetical protein C5O27_08910 [Gordonia alkanivorans]MDH3024042.1 hypothetical protein [Gordonia alkanivorans]
MTSSGYISVRAGALRMLVAALVLAAALVAVGFAWRAHAAGDALQQSREQLRERAGTIVADVFSVDSTRWQQDRSRARALVARDFLDSYGAQLSRPPEQGTAAVVWRPEVVSVVDADDTEGQALLRVAVTVRSDAPARSEAAATTVRRSVLARFVRADDAWLLAAADVIG